MLGQQAKVFFRRSPALTYMWLTEVEAKDKPNFSTLNMTSRSMNKTGEGTRPQRLLHPRNLSLVIVAGWLVAICLPLTV